MNINHVVFSGNLTRDAQLRYIGQNHTPVLDFGLANNRRYAARDAQIREEKCFVDLQLFGKSAEALAPHLKKGKPIVVEGRLQYDQWVDKQTSQTRSKLRVVALRVHLLPRSQAPASANGAAVVTEAEGAISDEAMEAASIPAAQEAEFEVPFDVSEVQ